MAIKYIVLFVETPRKFITAKLSIRKPGSSSVLININGFGSVAVECKRQQLWSRIFQSWTHAGLSAKSYSYSNSTACLDEFFYPCSI
jgi:hypothetical protein